MVRCWGLLFVVGVNVFAVGVLAVFGARTGGHSQWRCAVFVCRNSIRSFCVSCSWIKVAPLLCFFWTYGFFVCGLQWILGLDVCGVSPGRIGGDRGVGGDDCCKFGTQSTAILNISVQTRLLHAKTMKKTRNITQQKMQPGHDAEETGTGETEAEGVAEKMES